MLERLDPGDAYLEFAGARIPGLPLFDAPATAADGISGTLGVVGSGAAIAVVELSPVSVHIPDYEEMRHNAPHRGLVILCKGAPPGLGMLNADRFCQPYSAPAIQLSSETRDIHRADGCYVTLVGSNPLFHLPQDRWPHAVDTAAVARVADAAAGLVVRLTH